VQQGPFAPRALPRFLATPSLTATVSPSADFPVLPVIRPTLLHRFLDGTRTVSPVARHALVTVLSLPPRRSAMTFRSAHVMSCCFRPEPGGSASGFYFLSRPPVGSLALRPGDSLTILKMALSVGFIRFVSSTNATQATRLLTLTSVGLTPTEHVSLRWTHWSAIILYVPIYGFRDDDPPGVQSCRGCRHSIVSPTCCRPFLIYCWML